MNGGSTYITADLSVGPSKKLSVSQGPYKDKATFLIWRYMLLS